MWCIEGDYIEQKSHASITHACTTQVRGNINHVPVSFTHTMNMSNYKRNKNKNRQNGHGMQRIFINALIEIAMYIVALFQDIINYSIYKQRWAFI